MKDIIKGHSKKIILAVIIVALVAAILYVVLRAETAAISA